MIKTFQLDGLRVFYSCLGVVFADERHGDGPLHYAAKVGETVFEIYPAPEGTTPDATTRLGLAVANLGAVIEHLRAMGTPAPRPPQDTEWGRRAVVRDPDGRAVELYEL